MKNRVIARLLPLGFVLVLGAASLRADEGMWPITEVSKLDLAVRGIKVGARDIFNPEGLGLVNGVVQLTGCTGSFVSGQGLILTNHHCAFRAIQDASTKERDYLAEGFLTSSLEEEIPARGYTARITESYRDVSAEVLAALKPKMSPAERTKAVEKKSKEIVADTEKRNPGMRAEVAEMFAGRTYLLFVYTYLKDIRLVYAPPQGIGNFGGEEDNWAWPRHTGDFSFMRAYVGPDGRSADYSEKNVPYRPRVFLKVAAEGVREGEAIMIPGYPGRTYRHMTSHYLRFEENVRMPAVVAWYDYQIGLMEEMSASDRGVALVLAGRIKGLANTTKNYKGKLLGMRRLGLTAGKRAEEAELDAFIASDPKRRGAYAGLLKKIGEVYEEQAAGAARDILLSNLRSHVVPLSVAHTITEAALERRKPDLERESAYMDRNFRQTGDRLVQRLKEFHRETDRRILRRLLERAGGLPSGQRLAALDALFPNGYDLQALDAFLERLFGASRLGSEEAVNAALSMTPEELEKLGDPFLDLARALYPEHLRVREVEKTRKGALDRLLPQLVKVKQQFLALNFIPDANGTLRLTFGRIKGYHPRDGIYYQPVTTLDGVAEKSTGRDPFDSPESLLDLYRKKDFGRFAPDGFKSVPVCILYDADTTGGNSGSPVLNGRGELVGVNFDRAFEATINDFAWSQDYSRSIAVDIRYVLWVTQKIGRADRLLEEMNIPASGVAAGGRQGFPRLEGPYLGQKPPGMIPQPFAPGIITTDEEEGSSGFARNGTAFLFQKFLENRCHTYITRLAGGVWTAPELIPFWETMVHNGDFVFSSDDKTILYQVKSETESGLDSNVWRAELKAEGWGERAPFPSPVNTPSDESFASDTAEGTLYFFSRRPGGKGGFDLYICAFKDGRYGDAVNLESLNTQYQEWDPFIAPDESYLVFCSTKPGGFGRDDLYVTFKGKDGNWSAPVNMGEAVNSPGSENRPYVTREGRYFFFTSTRNGNRDTFWVQVGYLDRFRKMGD